MNKMDETVPGGLYLDSDGKGWHDANGNPLSEEEVAKRKALLAKVEEVPPAVEPDTTNLVAKKEKK